MILDDQKALKTLVNTLRFHGWVKILRLPGKTMLVADPDFITELRSQISDLTCEFSVPSQAIDDIKASEAKRIIVLSRTHEIRLVRQLRSTFPHRQVFSTLYDLCPKSFAGPFYEKQSSINSSEPISPVENIGALMLSSASSDSEHLGNIFEENTLGTIHKPFGKAAQALMHYVDHFEPFRYFTAYVKSSTNKDIFNIFSVEIEILEDVAKKTKLSLLRLKKIIEDRQIKAVYFQRRDKITQAALNALLFNHSANSIWGLPPVSYPSFVNSRTFGFVIAINSLHQTIGRESRIEKFLSQLPAVHVTVLEELLKTPNTVIESLAHFLSIPIQAKITVPVYGELYGKIDGLKNQIADFKREYIDRLGLHTSDAGSLITETEKLLSSRK
jgi:hypothetical protein